MVRRRLAVALALLTLAFPLATSQFGSSQVRILSAGDLNLPSGFKAEVAVRDLCRRRR
jgi:hypothetical protein